jgi:hypothetical protein
MISTMLRLEVVAGADPLRLERLTEDLRTTISNDKTLRSAGVVAQRPMGSSHAGSKGSAQDVATILLETAPFALPVLSALADVIGRWCARDRRSTVRISHGDRSMEITGDPTPEQRAAIERFLSDEPPAPDA